MQLILEKDINKDVSILAEDGFMPIIDIDNTKTKEIIQKINISNYRDQLLNDINVLGQKIESIDINDYSYIHCGNKLQFNRLSRGEKVFLVSLASKYCNIPIYLRYDIKQLTKTNLRKYKQMFDACDTITIICQNESEKSLLENKMEGRIK